MEYRDSLLFTMIYMFVKFRAEFRDGLFGFVMPGNNRVKPVEAPAVAGISAFC